MSRSWLWILAIVLVAAAWWWHEHLTTHPDSIVIAGGPSGGRYEQVASLLAEEIESRLNVETTILETVGSLENLELLRSGEVELILYQHGAEDVLSRVQGRELANADDRSSQPAFVANLYSEVAHFIVSRTSDITRPSDLIGKRVAIGRPNSGDYAMSVLALEHFGLDEDDIDPQRLSYIEIEERFRAGTLDAAFITAGLGAPIYERLFSRTDDEVLCDLRSIPYTAALASHQLSINEFEIPAGLYRLQDPIEPPEQVQTVAFRAQLLAGEELDPDLVEAVTEMLLSESFQKKAGLHELFAGGADFAREKPEFTIHSGALHVYEPELKPLLPTEFVEATEGMRSFIVSMLIAAYLLIRWWRDRTRHRAEHKLDRYIQSILEIERKQLDYDQHPGRDESEQLQHLLDDVTDLRQRALSEFNAHELNEDRAVDCFIEMCHALSDKINAKLTRQRLESLFRERAGSGEVGQSSGEETRTLDETGLAGR